MRILTNLIFDRRKAENVSRNANEISLRIITDFESLFLCDSYDEIGITMRDAKKKDETELIALEARVGGEKRRRLLSKISCQATMLQKSARSLHSVQVDASSIYRRVRLKKVGQEN